MSWKAHLAVATTRARDPRGLPMDRQCRGARASEISRGEPGKVDDDCSSAPGIADWLTAQLAFKEVRILRSQSPCIDRGFYCFNRLTNPFNQPPIPGTKYCSNLLMKPMVLSGTSPDD